MDWSATLSLTTSHARTHRANYGSFSSAAAPIKRHGSGSTISIPESIPEHQCVVQFATPHLSSAGEQVLEHYDVFGISAASSSSSSSQTLTITEKTTTTADATRLQTFKMLLTTTTSERVSGRGATARAAGEDLHDLTSCSSSSATAVASSYWLQERERMRLLRDKRHRARNGSPTKAATLRDDDDPETSQYRTVAIMCSVPLLLVVAFVVFVLAFGDGAAVAVAESAVVLGAATPTGVHPPTAHLRSVPASSDYALLPPTVPPPLPPLARRADVATAEASASNP